MPAGIRRLRSYPPTVRPLCVWGWSGDIAPDRVEHAIERLVRLGFGGVIVAPRGRSGLQAFMTPRWLDCLRAADQAAQKFDLELWAEAPLKGLHHTNLFPASSLSRYAILKGSPWSACPTHSIVAYYRRDSTGRVRRISNESEPKRLRTMAHLALSIVRGESLDLLESSAAEQYLAQVLAPQTAALLENGGKTAFRGFFVGVPEEPLGEFWNENLIGRLEEIGFSDTIGRAPGLYGETTGGESNFIHFYRLAVAESIQRHFVAPLMQWAGRENLRLVGPPELERDHGFPFWTFSAEGAERLIQARLPEHCCGTERLVEGDSNTRFVLVSTTSLRENRTSVSSIFQAAENALACSGGRAVLDWLPFAEDSALEWACEPHSLSLVMPGLRGLREMIMRLATWTLIGQTARRRPRVLVILPQTSLWRIPRQRPAAEKLSERARSAESIRLQRLMMRTQNCLRALSFDFETWQDCTPIPPRLRTEEHRTEPPYDLVILPGLLNLQHPSWVALADYAAAGGRVLALERYPAFVDGNASEDLTNWARQSIERCETIDHLSACLEDLIERPVRAISLTRGLQPRAPEVMGMEEDGRLAWVVACNPDSSNNVRGLAEISSSHDEFLDEVELEGGGLTAAAGVVRLENVLSVEVDLAPGQTRVFKLQKAPPAEIESTQVESSPLFSELVLAGDWKVNVADENLFPLTWMEYSLPGLPLMGPEHSSQINEAIARQLSLTGQTRGEEIVLKTSFEIEQTPPRGLAQILDLGLYFHPHASLRVVELNGIESDMDAVRACPRTGLNRLPLPFSVKSGANELVIHVYYPEDALLASEGASPWILGGRFGVLPRQGFYENEDGRIGAAGGFRLMACPGSSELLTDLVALQSSIIDGIHAMQAKEALDAAQLETSPLSGWIDWQGWPLLRDRRTLHEVGLPFYGGLLKIEGTFNLPSPGPLIGPWKTAIFEMGPAMASWVALKVNGVTAGSVGLSPYRRDITQLLDPSGRNTLSLRVWFSWSEALGPFHRSGADIPPESTFPRRGFQSLPRILLQG